MYDVGVGKINTLPPTPTYIYDVGVGKTCILPPTPTYMYDVGVGKHAYYHLHQHGFMMLV